MSFENQTNS